MEFYHHNITVYCMCMCETDREREKKREKARVVLLNIVISQQGLTFIKLSINQVQKPAFDLPWCKCATLFVIICMGCDHLVD